MIDRVVPTNWRRENMVYRTYIQMEKRKYGIQNVYTNEQTNERLVREKITKKCMAPRNEYIFIGLISILPNQSTPT